MWKFWNWMLILAGAGLVLFEVALGGFAGLDLVLIGSAFLIGGALGLVFADLYLGMIVAGVLCAVYILIGRRWVRKKLHLGTPEVKSNADAVLGERGMVIAPIAAHQAGRVRVGAEEWRAVLAPGAAGPFEAGAEITVAGVDGVTLQVR
jgi:membrane protein implicated in regulation of membrane protease activity